VADGDRNGAGLTRHCWGVLTLDVPPALEDELCGRLGWAGQGVEVVDGSAGRSRVRVFFGRPEQALEACEWVGTILTGVGLEPRDCGLSVEEVEDERWVERYQALLRPFPLGAGFEVRPSAPSTGSGPSGRIPLWLVPGRAFGTGEHATTQLCVEALEREVREGSRWLDLGCGTAILSIVCHLSGAAEVHALDNDPDAVTVAGEVLGANGLAGRVDVSLGGAADSGGRAWDGVVANIGAAYFREWAEVVAGLLVPGGVLVASGFLIEDLPEMRERFATAGLREFGRAGREPWAVLLARRAP